MINIKKKIPIFIKTPITNLYKQLLFDAKQMLNPPVMVYQMGKVGSTSITESLCVYYSGPMVHNHTFSCNHHQVLTRKAWNYVETGKPIYVISLVREPIGRNISAFFQNLSDYTGCSPSENLNIPVESLIDIFLSKFNHNLPLEWFNNNIKKHFDIDVFDTPFPSEGFCIYSKKNINLLVIKLETSDELKIQALQNFLGLKKLKLINSNLAEEKYYSSLYKEVRNKIVFSEDYINSMCNSKYFQHFYSPEEIENVRQKWSRY